MAAGDKLEALREKNPARRTSAPRQNDKSAPSAGEDGNLPINGNGSERSKRAGKSSRGGEIRRAEQKFKKKRRFYCSFKLQS